MISVSICRKLTKPETKDVDNCKQMLSLFQFRHFSAMIFCFSPKSSEVCRIFSHYGTIWIHVSLYANSQTFYLEIKKKTDGWRWYFSWTVKQFKAQGRCRICCKSNRAAHGHMRVANVLVRVYPRVTFFLALFLLAVDRLVHRTATPMRLNTLHV